MINVVLESPYSGRCRRNAEYLKLALQDCIRRGEAAYASHAYLTNVLDDTVPEERALGLAAGRSLSTTLLAGGAKLIAYVDFGVSAGMAESIAMFAEQGHAVEERRILPVCESCGTAGMPAPEGYPLPMNCSCLPF